MKAPKSVSGVVLAGGYSSRMGRDKAALPFRGTTLLAYQVQKLRTLGIEDLMISGSMLSADGARFVPDVYPHRGPLSGIHACLEAAEHDAVLFLSVDVPLVPPDALRALLDAHTGGVTLLQHGDQREPLLAVYDRALAAACREILQGDRTAVRQLLEQADVTCVPFTGDEALLQNCNTPAEYEAAMKPLL